MTAPGSEAGREVRVDAAGRTDTGLSRADNQDRLLIADLEALRAGGDGGAAGMSADGDGRDAASVGPVQFVLGGSGGILLVADGMGGVVGGAIASGLTVSAVRAALAASVQTAGSLDAASFARLLRNALHVANARIHDESSRDDRYRGMGSTATLAGILDGVVYLAQVGDSRAYLVRGGHAVRLTRDQSLVQNFVDAGVLTEAEARDVHDGTLLQALGVAATVHPEITAQELRRGDVVLLCSDGLSRVVVDEEIGAAVARAPDSAALCDELVKLANLRGGPDNVTVVAARFEGDGLPEALRGDTVARRVMELPEG